MLPYNLSLIAMAALILAAIFILSSAIDDQNEVILDMQRKINFLELQVNAAQTLTIYEPAGVPPSGKAQ